VKLQRILAVLVVLVLGVSLVGIVGLGAGKIAVVFDVGRRGDLSFNDMAYNGASRAASDFGMKLDYLESSSASDYLPNVRTFARDGSYDIIIAVGYLLGDAVTAAAGEFPNQKFAIIDSVVTAPNVLSITFRENEASALAGALAAMLAVQYNYKYVGAVFGIEIPVLYHFEAGYRFGIDWGLSYFQTHEKLAAKPNVGLLYVYTGSFDDVAKGKAAMETQLAQGAVCSYNVAGKLGIGMQQAITEKHDSLGTRVGPPFFLGVDQDQDYQNHGLYGIASGMKRVDNGTYDAIKSVVDGTFKGEVLSLGLANGGGSLSDTAALLDFIQIGIAGKAADPNEYYTIIANWSANRASVPYWIWQAVDGLNAAILAGTITVPNANTKDEMGAVRAQYPLTGK